MLRQNLLILGLMMCMINANAEVGTMPSSGLFLQLSGSYYNANQGNKLTSSFRQSSINALEDNPPLTLSGSNSNSSFSLIPTLGYQFSRYFSIQLGYQNFNQQTQNADVTASIIPAISENFVITNSATIKTSAYYLTGKFQYPITQSNFAVLGEAGVASLNQRIDETSTGITEFHEESTNIARWNTTKTYNSSFISPLIGLGVEYTIPSLQRMAIFIKWRRVFELSDDANFTDPTTAVGGVATPTRKDVVMNKLQTIDTFNFGIQYLF